MSTRPWDVRLRRVTWEPVPSWSVRRRVRLLILPGLPFAVWYFGWLLNPDRVGTPYLYGILIAAELFNLMQALGFWWTVANERVREKRGPSTRVAVDVFIPVYKEPPDIVDLTIAAAVGLRGAEVRVHVLDDGNDDAMRDLAAGYGVGYIRRPQHTGAKAGNINHALTKTSAPFIAVFDSDHVADPGFLEATLGWMDDSKVAFVQTPQYYANTEDNRIAAASWAQQALFFGAIARGKDGLDAVFCCGTNVLFRREAFESVGGFPTNSLTEDFELSIHLHEKGWASVYVPDVLARGLGPEDTASYVSQQQRWARGCLSGIPRALKARLPLKLKAQYLLSGLYFLSGWTVLIYMSFPVVRLLGGGQPIGGIDAPEFLLHFVPVLRCGAHDGGGRRCRLVYVRRVCTVGRELLDPCALDGLHRAPQKGLLRGDPEEGRSGPTAGGGDARARGRRDSRLGMYLRSDSQPGRRHDQQRVVRPGPRLDPDDRVLGGAPEAARPGR